MLTGHTGRITCIAFLVGLVPEGGERLVLLTGSEDRSIRAWDGLTGADLYTLRGHAGRPPARG